MLSIKLTSCFPDNTTIESQISKLAEEYSEIMLADFERRCSGEWENLFSELLDLAQVCIGGMEILLNDNSRNNYSIKNEMLDRLLEEHQMKLMRRRKEWRRKDENRGD